MNNKQNNQSAVPRHKVLEMQRAGMIIGEHKLLNLEFPFTALDGLLTPNERFCVRNHFPEISSLKEKERELKIEGASENTLPARATAGGRRARSLEHAEEHGGYLVNHALPFSRSKFGKRRHYNFTIFRKRRKELWH